MSATRFAGASLINSHDNGDNKYDRFELSALEMERSGYVPQFPSVKGAARDYSTRESKKGVERIHIKLL